MLSDYNLSSGDDGTLALEVLSPSNMLSPSDRIGKLHLTTSPVLQSPDSQISPLSQLSGSGHIAAHSGGPDDGGFPFDDTQRVVQPMEVRYKHAVSVSQGAATSDDGQHRPISILINSQQQDARPRQARGSSVESESIRTPVPDSTRGAHDGGINILDAQTEQSALPQVATIQNPFGSLPIMAEEVGSADLEAAALRSGDVRNPQHLQTAQNVEGDDGHGFGPLAVDQFGAATYALNEDGDFFDFADLPDLAQTDLAEHFLADGGVWGAVPEEKEAFLFISSSWAAAVCTQCYRCCPLYRMNLGFCCKMGTELCHSLCTVLTVLFFLSVVVFQRCFSTSKMFKT